MMKWWSIVLMMVFGLSAIFFLVGMIFFITKGIGMGAALTFFLMFACIIFGVLAFDNYNDFRGN